MMYSRLKCIKTKTGLAVSVRASLYVNNQSRRRARQKKNEKNPCLIQWQRAAQADPVIIWGRELFCTSPLWEEIALMNSDKNNQLQRLLFYSARSNNLLNVDSPRLHSLTIPSLPLSLLWREDNWTSPQLNRCFSSRGTRWAAIRQLCCWL